MNETLLNISEIIIVLLSTVLVRPKFWKQRKELRNIDIVTCIIVQLFLYMLCLLLILLGLVNSKLIFFNGYIIFAIITFSVNILFGNYLLTGGSLLNTFKSKNFLISCCVLLVFSILTFVLNKQFSQVVVTTTETETKRNLEAVLLDDTIAMERSDIVKATKLMVNVDVFYNSYASNGRIIYWFSDDAAVILHDNTAWIKEYNHALLFLKLHKQIGFVVDDENHLYQAYAIIKYKNFKFYVDHYTLYDCEKDEFIDYDTLPTWATNK